MTSMEYATALKYRSKEAEEKEIDAQRVFSKLERKVNYANNLVGLPLKDLKSASQEVSGNKLVVNNGKIFANFHFVDYYETPPYMGSTIYLRSNEGFAKKALGLVEKSAEDADVFLGILGGGDNALRILESVQASAPNVKAIMIDANEYQLIWAAYRFYKANEHGEIGTLNCKGETTMKIFRTEIEVFPATLVEALNALSREKRQVFVYSSNVPKVTFYTLDQRIEFKGYQESPDSTKEIFSAFVRNTAKGSKLMFTNPSKCTPVGVVENVWNGVVAFGAYSNGKVYYL